MGRRDVVKTTGSLRGRSWVSDVDATVWSLFTRLGREDHGEPTGSLVGVRRTRYGVVLLHPTGARFRRNQFFCCLSLCTVLKCLNFPTEGDGV